jgi:hypothetical protein
VGGNLKEERDREGLKNNKIIQINGNTLEKDKTK